MQAKDHQPRFSWRCERSRQSSVLGSSSVEGPYHRAAGPMPEPWAKSEPPLLLCGCVHVLHQEESLPLPSLSLDDRGGRAHRLCVLPKCTPSMAFYHYVELSAVTHFKKALGLCVNLLLNEISDFDKSAYAIHVTNSISGSTLSTKETFPFFCLLPATLSPKPFLS